MDNCLTGLMIKNWVVQGINGNQCDFDVIKQISVDPVQQDNYFVRRTDVIVKADLTYW